MKRPRGSGQPEKTKEFTKHNYSHNKFATPKNKRNTNRKATFTYLVARNSLPPHAYYCINLCQRQQKLYESYLRSKLACRGYSRLGNPFPKFITRGSATLPLKICSGCQIYSTTCPLKIFSGAKYFPQLPLQNLLPSFSRPGFGMRIFE